MLQLKAYVKRPYAAQMWTSGLLVGDCAPLLLQLLARDLHTDADEQGVVVTNIELWTSPTRGVTGLFSGDTSGLPGDGWTKLATL
jgi:hypothetical protein